jgi:hypothetical protein
MRDAFLDIAQADVDAVCPASGPLASDSVVEELGRVAWPVGVGSAAEA